MAKSRISCSFILVLALLISAQPSHIHAQFDNLLKKTSDKLADEVANMAVEKLSDIIAQKAAEQIERKFDEMLMAALEADSSYQSPYDRDSAMQRLGASYGAFLRGLNESADLPADYNFDLNMLVTVTTENEEPQNMRWYFSRTEPLMGIQTATSETESQFIVMDLGNDVMVMYHDDNGKKTAQAIPNVMKLAGSMANSDTEQQMDFTVKPLNKKKKIAGYKCEGYEGVGEDQRFEAWTTEELGIDWRDNFGEVMENFASADVISKSYANMKGMALASVSHEVPSGKLVSSYDTQEVDESKTTIVNAEYSFGSQ